MKNKNYFIAVEGGEGTGKSTFVRLLAEELRKKGYEVISTREPGGTELGEKIRNLILENESPYLVESMLFAAARQDHIIRVIEPALYNEKPTIIICDRYILSNQVYQGYFYNGIEGANLQMKLNQFCGEVIKPDITFLLDCDPRIGLNRIQKNNREKNRFDEMTLAQHKKVREGFLRILDLETGCVLDASGDDPNVVVKEALVKFEKKEKESRL